MVRHGRTYWMIVTVAALASLVLFSAILAPIIRRGWGDKDATLRATQDTLVSLRAQTAEAVRQMKEQDHVLMQSNHLLDSLLRSPPKVVYMHKPAGNGPAVLTGASPSDDLGPGDTLVPMVPLPAYEALAKGCSQAQDDCRAAQERKDTVIARQDRQIATVTSIVAQKDDQLKREHRANFFGRIRDVGTGIGAGALLCLFLCNHP